MPSRKLYPKDFKEDAVRRAMEPGAMLSRIATDLDLNSAMLGRWVREHKSKRDGKTPGVPSTLTQNVLNPKDTVELERLRQRIAELTAERDLLKATLSHYLKG